MQAVGRFATVLGERIDEIQLHHLFFRGGWVFGAGYGLIDPELGCRLTRRHPMPLTGDRHGLLRHSFPEQYLQTARGVVCVAQAKEFAAPAEPRVQGRVFATDLAVPTQGSTVEPQVGLAIELVLQMVSEGIIGRVMAHAIEGTVADAPNGLVFHDDREPLACLVADFAPAGDEHRHVTFYRVNRQKAFRRRRLRKRAVAQ
jgi:hypothetical protein